MTRPCRRPSVLRGSTAFSFVLCLLVAAVATAAADDWGEARAHYLAAWSAIMDQGRWTESERQFRAALSVDPDWHLARALVGRITTDVEEREELLAWLDAHLDSAPADERLLLDLYRLNLIAANARDRGETMPEGFSGERQALAIRNFRAYLQSHPTDAYVSAELVEWIHAAEGSEAALAAMDAIDPQARTAPFFLSYSASLLLELGRVDEAAAMAARFEAAIDDEEAPTVHAMRARMLAAKGDLAAARAAVARAVALDPANLSARGLQRAIEGGEP